MSELESGSRVEALLRGILDGETSTTIEPATRVEVLLKAILENGGGGGGGGGLPSVTDADIGKLLRVLEGGVWGADSGDDLARIDGYYESLTSGETTQIISKVGVTNKEPYQFRPTGGSADVGNRKKIKKIVGASAAYNQLVDGDTGFNGYGATVTYDSTENEFEVSFTDTSNGHGLQNSASFDGIPVGHVCFVTLDAKTNSLDGMKFRIYLNGVVNSYDYTPGLNYQRFGKVVTTSTQNQFDLYCKNIGSDSKLWVKNLQIIDLTDMFGSAVADAIASKEATLAGSGIAWVRSCGYLTKDFYPYNAGAFVSAKPSAHKTVGFNAWDEVWESGYVSNQGVELPDDTRIRSKNFIPVVPNTDYYVNAPCSVYMRYYDEDKNFIGVWDGHSPARGDVTTPAVRTMPANCRYLRFWAAEASYSGDICINLSHSGYRNGDYEAYSERVYPLADAELKGLLKVDESGNLYADGDTYAPDGTLTRRFYEVSSADCTVGKYANDGRWKITFPQSAPDIVIVDKSAVGNLKASRYFTSTSKNAVSGANLYKIAQSDTSATKTRELIFTIDYNSITTVEDAAAWVTNHPFSILYECAESTETGTAYAASMVCDDFGTEEFVDERAIPMPVGHETFYQANNADKLDHLPFPADADGDYIIHQSGKTMTLKATSSPLPAFPSEDGEYNLKLTVSGDTKTLSWEAIS